jgi:hypothetical protein
MHLPKPTEGGDFTPPPAGTYPAICYRFIDLGTQTSNFQGETKHQRKVMISWEITDEELRMDDGRPFTVNQRYTWSMHEKSTLRKTLESWRGKPFEDADFGEGGFDTKNLLGAPCLMSIMQVTKDGKTYANITGVSKLMKGLNPGQLVNETVYLSMDDFDRETFGKLSEGLQNIIKNSPEYQGMGRSNSAPDYHGGGDPGWSPDDSEIPF